MLDNGSKVNKNLCSETFVLSMVLLTITEAILAGLKQVEELQSPEKCAQTCQHDPALEAAQVADEGAGDENAQHAVARHNADEPSLDAPEIGNAISHAQILRLFNKLQELSPNPPHLDSLLRGSQIYVPPPPPKSTKTPEYEALMARLRREQEEREYAQLTRPSPYHVSPSMAPSASAAFAFKATEAYMDAATLGDDEATYNDINRQTTLIFNVLISVIACAAALWTMASWWSTPARLFLSMGGSFVVGVAEVGVYYGYIYRLKDAVKTEKNKKEVKSVVGSWVVPPKGVAKMDSMGGRGIKGAKGAENNVRRRKPRESEKAE
jgi:hypothetical protein